MARREFLISNLAMFCLPLGISQLYKSVGSGYVEAREPSFLTDSLNNALEWLRRPGDVLFIAGGALPALYIAVVRFREITPALDELGYRLDDIAPDYLRLPFLLHYGRSDATVAYYGANISPVDVEEVMNALEELAGRCASYALLVGEDERSNKQLEIAFELRQGGRAPWRQDALRRKFLARLAEINQDYREAARFIPDGFEPKLAFYKPGEGPFADIDPRLKRPYIQRAQ
jgi:acyl-CoA synthetase (AMP-forming)/AMP-acid ligase II